MHYHIRFAILFCLACLLSAAPNRAWSQEGEQNPVAPPILKLDAGPSNFISQLSFSPDGKKLYATGWDKVVYVWNYDSETEEFQYSPQETFRIPIGIGGFGLINAMSASRSGKWLAVGGRGWSTGYAGARSSGFVWPNRASSSAMLFDRGQIYLWDTATRELKVLRGHAGVVKAICFLPTAKDNKEIMVSVAEEVTANGILVVLRAWDVNSGQQIQAKSIGYLPVGRWIPILRSLENTNRIVLAWGEDVVQNNRPASKIRIWDIDSNALSSVPAPRYTITAENVGDELWSGAIGRAQKWSASGQALRPTNQVGLGQWLPVSSTKSEGENEATRIVYVMRKLSNQQPSEYKPAILNTKTNQVTFPIAPWTDMPTQSPVCVSPDNKYLAIARQTKIYLFDFSQTQTATNESVRPKQILSGAGQPLDSIELVKKGESTGLLLKATTSNGVHRSVFNLDDSQIVTDSEGWTRQLVDSQGWQTRTEVDQSNQRRIVVTSKNGQAAARVDVLSIFPPAGVRSEDIKIDATAIFPSKGLNPPLLAISYSLRGEPSVDIFNARTGEFLRTLSGHSGRVTQLIFHRDGNWLVSASIDRTVRFWNVGNIEERVLGKVGMINDFIVSDDNNRVVVFSVDNAQGAKGIQPQDVVVGFVENNRLLPVSRSWEFYRGLSRMTPGDEFTIRVSRNRVDRDVVLNVQQGADESKPTFSLFFDELDRQPRWIAWSPMGKYDVSDDAMERILGWHFNPQEADRAVKFAAVSQYRPEARERDLLKSILTSEIAPIPVPQTTIGFVDANGGEVPADVNGLLTTRTKRLTMIAEINELPAKWIESVQWRVGDQEFEDLPREFDSIYASEISDGKTRTPIRVQIRIRTKDKREYVYTRDVRFVPAAPVLASLSPAGQVTSVKEKQIGLAGKFRMAESNATIVVQHVLPDGKVKTLPNSQIKTVFDKEQSELTFEATDVPLQLGKNQFQISVHNTEAIEQTKSMEQLLTSRTVFLLPPKPPAVQISGIVSLPDNAAVEIASAGEPAMVSKPSVRISGIVASAERPTLAFNDDSITLTSEAGKHQFKHEITFKKPGENKISINATNSGGKHELKLDFDYRPELPTLSPTLSPKETAITVVDGKLPNLSLTSIVSWPNDFPATWQLLVNGEVHSSGQIEGRVLDVPVKLQPDSSRSKDTHRLQLRVSNQWKKSTQYDLGVIRLLHPPTVEILVAKQIDKTSQVELQVKTASPLRPVIGETIYVDGKEIAAKTLSSKMGEGQQRSEQVLTYRVPVSVGSHVIRYTASNNDGSSKQVSKKVEVLPAPKPAKVRFESPVAGESFGSRDVKYQVFVQSESLIRSVEVIHKANGFELNRVSIPADQIQQVSKNRYLIRRAIAADDGSNQLEVLVENEAGVARSLVGFTVKLPPVSIKIDRFVTVPDGKSHLVTISRSGLSLGNPLEKARVRIQGRIRFDGQRRPKANTELPLRIWTNGFLKTESIKTTDASETKFDVSVVLNQRQNRIRLEIPSLVVDETSQWFAQDIRLASLNPEQGQRLRLLGMGVQIKDGSNALTTDSLNSTIESALRTNDKSNQAFSKVVKYGPLGGTSAKPTNFIMQFMKMKADIRDSQLRGDTRDLVLIYYQGMAVENREHGFILQDIENWRNPARSRGSSITSRRLVQMLKELPGAHVLLLDVAEKSPPKIARAWPREPTLGIIRLARRDQQQLSPEPRGDLLSMLSRVFDKPSQPNEIRLRRVVDGVETEVAGRRVPSVVYDPHLPTQFSEIVMYRK